MGDARAAAAVKADARATRQHRASRARATRSPKTRMDSSDEKVDSSEERLSSEEDPVDDPKDADFEVPDDDDDWGYSGSPVE